MLERSEKNVTIYSIERIASAIAPKRLAAIRRVTIEFGKALSYLARYADQPRECVRKASGKGRDDLPVKAGWVRRDRFFAVDSGR